MKHIKKAFTLSETLITLGIIGIIAAITLLVLTSKIEKTILKNQIKKNYSTLSQVLEKVTFEYGDGLVIESGRGFKEFNEAFLSNLKIIQICNKNALAKGCIRKYTGLNITGCSAFNENNIYNNSTVYILYDGSFIIPYNMDWRSLWLVDVNGKKGPNKAGYDLFEVTLDENSLDIKNSKRLRYRGSGCLNQGNPKPVKDGLDDYQNIDNW